MNNKLSERGEEGDLDSICESLSVPASGSNSSNVTTKLGLYSLLPGHVVEATRIVLISGGREQSVDWKEALPKLPQPYKDVDLLIPEALRISREVSIVSMTVRPYLNGAIKERIRQVKDVASALLGKRRTRGEYYQLFRSIGDTLSEIPQKCYSELRRMVETRTTEHPSGWYESVSLEPHIIALRQLVHDLLRDYPDERKQLEEFRADLPLIWEYIDTVNV